MKIDEEVFERELQRQFEKQRESELMVSFIKKPNLIHYVQCHVCFFFPCRCSKKPETQTKQESQAHIGGCF